MKPSTHKVGIASEASSAPSDNLQKVHIMIKPSYDWLTQPPAVAADGNEEMLKAVHQKKTHPAGSGSMVIKNLALLYEHLDLKVALLESSKAAQQVTKRVIGQPNPDDVFTVDCCTGHTLQDSDGSGNYVNIINQMSAATRLLEPFVMQIIATRLGAKNILTQPKEAKFEGGDFTFLPNALGDAESLLITGDGANSRSNKAGHEWLLNTLKPKNHLTVTSPEFHRDLVSVFVQDVRGALVQALLALDCIQNSESLVSTLKQWGIDVVAVPQGAVSHCAVNLLVHPGLLVGMQSHSQLTDILKDGLPAGIQYHSLPPYLQQLMKGFIDMQGGANCVSGHVLVESADVDLSDGNIANINNYLHSRDCEDYLQAKAEEIRMSDAVEAVKAKQAS